jgi:predicted transcriptional regulator
MKLEKSGCTQITRSKLELYVDILKVLWHSGPLKFADVINKANVNSTILKKHLYFLIKQGLVEEQTIKKNSAVFAITQKGVNVLKYFRIIACCNAKMANGLWMLII